MFERGSRPEHEAGLATKLIQLAIPAIGAGLNCRTTTQDVAADDLLAEGLSCGLHRIERLMRVQGLRARPRRRGLPKDDGLRSVIADNILDRQFTAEAPNQRWIADFTYCGFRHHRAHRSDIIAISIPR